MVKALAGKTVVLGLSEVNIKRLQAEEPIVINLKDLGLPDQDILIFAGKDEESMYMAMLDKIGPNTKLV